MWAEQKGPGRGSRNGGRKKSNDGPRVLSAWGGKERPMKGAAEQLGRKRGLGGGVVGKGVEGKNVSVSATLFNWGFMSGKIGG